MPPRKAAKSLLDTALASSCHLVLSAAKSVEKSHQCASGLSFDVVGCKEVLQPIQDHLRDFLPLSLYESLFHDVLQQGMKNTGSFKKLQITDERILYSIFIYENVILKRLPMKSFNINNVGSEDLKNEVDILRNQRRIEFWLERIPMLTKLVEVDLRTVFNDDIILAFSRSCTKLSTLSVLLKRLPLTTLETVLRTFTNLQKFNQFKFYGNAIDKFVAPLGTDHKLKLTRLALSWVNAEQFNLMLDRCPALEDLEVLTDTGSYCEIMQSLAIRPLKLSSLSIPYSATHPEAFHNVLSIKGSNITHLSILCFDLDMPLLELHIVSKACKNLIVLEIDSQWMRVDQVLNPRTAYKISFPKLQRLNVSTRFEFGGEFGLIAMADCCTVDSVNLTNCEMSFTSGFGDMVGMEDALIELFRTNRRMKQLVRLGLDSYVGDISERLTRTVYEECPNLTYFATSSLTHQAKLFLEDVRRSVIRDNLDLYICKNRNSLALNSQLPIHQ